MKINLKVKRYDPEEQGNGRVWWQDYSVEASESTTVLDALIKVREEQDGTLGFALFMSRVNLWFVRNARQRTGQAEL